MIDTATDSVIHDHPERGPRTARHRHHQQRRRQRYRGDRVRHSIPVPARRRQRWMAPDDAKAGHVTIIGAATDTIIGDDRHQSRSPTPASRRPATPCSAFATGPRRHLSAPAPIRTSSTISPSAASSPSCPTPAPHRTARCRFNVNTQSLLSAIDTDHQYRRRRTINMHLAVQNQTNPAKRSSPSPGPSPSSTRPTKATWSAPPATSSSKLKVDPNTGVAVRAERSHRPDARARGPNRQESARHRRSTPTDTARLRDELRLARRLGDGPGRSARQVLRLRSSPPTCPLPARPTIRCTSARNSTTRRSANSIRPRRRTHHHRTHVRGGLGLLRHLPSVRPVATTSSGSSPPDPNAQFRSTPISTRPIRHETPCARSTGPPSATKKRTSN